MAVIKQSICDLTRLLTHSEAVRSHVEGKVLTHNGQTIQSNITRHGREDGKRVRERLSKRV
jgi:hypothetical protein